MSDKPKPAAPADRRDHYIAVRKSDIVAALDERTPAANSRRQLQRLWRLLGAITHHQYYERLERLRNNYFYFDPELQPHAHFARIERDRAGLDFIEALRRVLAAAGFIEMSHAEIDRAHRERRHLRVELRTPLKHFRAVQFFRRGHREQPFEVADWFGLRRRTFEVTVYDDVVLLVMTKSAKAAAPPRRSARRDAPKVRPGAILLKYFSDVVAGDLNALVPDVRVVMSTLDKLILGVPALAGGIPMLLNLGPALTTLALLIGFYLGISAAVEGDRTKSALAAVSGLVALGGFLMQQWIKYQRQALLHQKQLTDNVYYRNINNNAGIFDAIIGAAEEQECKEAFLAYHFLASAADKPGQADLDRRIEAWLKQTFGIDVAFACDAALVHLDRLGLLRRDGDGLAVAPIGEALDLLERQWCGFFPASA